MTFKPNLIQLNQMIVKIPLKLGQIPVKLYYLFGHWKIIILCKQKLDKKTRYFGQHWKENVVFFGTFSLQYVCFLVFGT